MNSMQRRDNGDGRPGYVSRAGALALMALALAGTDAADARANPNAGRPPAAAAPAGVKAALGADPTSSIESAIGAGPVARSEPAGIAAPTANMDTWHARSVARLSRALQHHEAMAKAGGWPAVPDGPSIKPQMVDPRAPLLRQRLEMTGDMAPDGPTGHAAPVYPTRDGTLIESSPLLFDVTLQAGVRSFQARHGLFVDGVVGRRTLAALNVPVAARIKSLKINLERLQKFEPWGPSYVLVNIPGFEAHLIREHALSLTSRVIVGEPDWPTPQLNGMMSRVIVNPHWNVPKSILRQEIIPRMLEDPEYLARENIRVFSGWHVQARELDPAEIDWSGPAARIYRLRQDPGPQNALGKFKFTFDNSQSIYLHDTPSRRLFNRSARALSHGCVRVEKPLELAEWLLAGQDRWNRAALDNAISSGDNRWIILKRPVPIHLVYWTAWADEDGRAQFRDDIYKRDWKPYASEEREQQGT